MAQAVRREKVRSSSAQAQFEHWQRSLKGHPGSRARDRAARSAMSALLETLRFESAQSSSGLAGSQEAFDSEGKYGIPRFSGEPTQLPEYTCRVQMKILREKSMEESELKKLGPLGLRLVEGLRGRALRLAQQLKPEDLAKP